MIGKAIAIGAAPVIGGVIGAASGAAWGGNTPGMNISESAQAGMVAGAAIGAVGTVAAMNPLKTGKMLGKVGLGVAEGVGGLAIGATEAVGGAAIGTAKAATSVGVPVATYAAGKYSSIGAGVLNKTIKPTRNPNNVLGHKLTGFGAGLVFGSAVVSGATEAFNDFNRNRMGQSDGQITRATPRTPSYANNAGATGDLVFAMNKNRRG